MKRLRETCEECFIAWALLALNLGAPTSPPLAISGNLRDCGALMRLQALRREELGELGAVAGASYLCDRRVVRYG